MTYFDITGNIGRVTKKLHKGDKKATYISIASSSFYNKKTTTTWINNIVFFGTMADVVANKVSIGFKIRVSGTISTKRTGKNETVFFVGEKFELQVTAEEQRADRAQQQAVSDLPDGEDVYMSGDTEEGEGDLPY